MSRKISTHRIAILTFFTLVMAICLAYWVMAYRQTHQVYQQLKHYSQRIHAQNDWQTRLQHEQHLLQLIDDSRVRRYRWLGMTEVDDIYQKIEAMQTQDINLHFEPYLKRLTTAYLRNQSDADPLALYQTLKVYLLASTEQKRHQANTIRHWLQPRIDPKLLPSLERAISLGKVHWHADTNLIASTQQKLQRLPAATTAFLVIQNYFPQKPVPIHFRTPTPGILANNKLSIPELYTSNLFLQVFQKHIPAMAQQAAAGDWVTGRTQHTINQPAQLVSAIQNQYLQQFQSHWQTLLQSLSLQPATSLKQLQYTIEQLQGHHTPVWQWVTTLNNNATLYRNQPSPLANFLTKNRGYQGFQAALFMLNKDITSIVNNPNPNAASFAYSANRMQSSSRQDNLELSIAVAKQLPAPMNQWLMQLSQTFWQITLANSKHYMQQQWAHDILKPYRAYIAERYPVFSYAKSNIELKQFNRFFAPNGTLDGFIAHYLQPFIQQTDRHWRLKTKDGEQLALSKAHIDMLTRADLIKKMFFKREPHSAQASFSLKANGLNKHTQRAIINLEGQMYTISHKKLADKHFNWPGPYPGFVTVQLTDSHGKEHTKTYTGSWAWFKLIDHARMQPRDQLNQFALHLSLGSEQADYTLTADELINPFIPHVLAQFRCPQQL